MDVNKDDKTSGTNSPYAGYYSNTVPAHDPLLKNPLRARSAESTCAASGIPSACHWN